MQLAFWIKQHGGMKRVSSGGWSWHGQDRGHFQEPLLGFDRTLDGQHRHRAASCYPLSTDTDSSLARFILPLRHAGGRLSLRESYSLMSPPAGATREYK